MAIPLQQNPCPVCDATRPQPAYQVKGFTIARCGACGMHYTNPRLPTDALYEIYRRDYFHSNKDGYEDYELSAHLRKKTFEKWYADIRPFLHRDTGKSLDIGCAAGYFMDVLKSDGWQPEGIELDESMRGTPRARGYQVFDQPLEFFTPTGTYDLITLFDVIEHLPGLKADVAKIAGMLSPQGCVALVTPDITSLQRKIFGARWFQFKPTEHIYYFSPDALRRVFAPHGLEVVLLKRAGQYADVSFLHRRLIKYGFTGLAKLFDATVRLFGLANRYWYADTGSMFVVLRKKK
jgi:2-polyprenyl-3-methyl-5-hydroxy-6-metoxy-1,4-benzoquinol methylase